MGKQELKEKEIRKTFNELNEIASSPICFSLSVKEQEELKGISNKMKNLQQNILNKIKGKYNNKVFSDLEMINRIMSEKPKKLITMKLKNNDDLIIFENKENNYTYIDVYVKISDSYVNQNELLSALLAIKKTKIYRYDKYLQFNNKKNGIDLITKFYSENWD